MTTISRKLIVAALTTVDGVHDSPRSFAGPYFDDEAAARSMAALESCDAMLMGRNTYEYFAPAWSRATGGYAQRVNGIAKYVFSSTMASAEWSNSKVVSGDVVEAVADLKRQAGGDLMIYGYGRLAQTLLEHGLVDEVKLSVFPVLAASGTPLFRPGQTQPLRLISVESRSNGVLEVAYDARPATHG